MPTSKWKTKHRHDNNLFFILLYFFFFIICLHWICWQTCYRRKLLSAKPLSTQTISAHTGKYVCPSVPRSLSVILRESRSPCSVQNKPKGVFMNTQQVNRSATVGSIRLSCSNVKLTWYTHRTTTELSTCPEGTNCRTTSSLPQPTATSKVGKVYKLNEALWIYIIAPKPFCIPLAVCFNSVLVSQRVLLHRPRKSTCSLQITTV